MSYTPNPEPDPLFQSQTRSFQNQTGHSPSGSGQSSSRIDEVIQLMRTCTIEEIRRALQRYENQRPMDFGAILDFYRSVK